MEACNDGRISPTVFINFRRAHDDDNHKPFFNSFYMYVVVSFMPKVVRILLTNGKFMLKLKPLVHSNCLSLLVQPRLEFFCFSFYSHQHFQVYI